MHALCSYLRHLLHRICPAVREPIEARTAVLAQRAYNVLGVDTLDGALALRAKPRRRRLARAGTPSAGARCYTTIMAASSRRRPLVAPPQCALAQQAVHVRLLQRQPRQLHLHELRPKGVGCEWGGGV